MATNNLSEVKNLAETDLDLVESLRPSLLHDFTGQAKLKDNLRIFIEAAKSRREALDHTLLYGPPGLGKTTLAQIIAHEMNVNIRTTAAPMLSKAGDLAAILTNLQENDILFIDEIHRLAANIEEVLYSAMEDFALDIIVGDGPAARTVRLKIARFTLVGATTRMGMLSAPLRDRFGIQLKLDFYDALELQSVIMRAVKIINCQISEQASYELAKRSRGTPRIALRLLRRIRDFAHYAKKDEIDMELMQDALQNLGIDQLGLDMLDRRYLQYIWKSHNGGPVGIETIAAGIAEDKGTIEDTIEPYLMQVGLINRTFKGRVLTQNGNLLASEQ
jgi:Holliday junction DNA helicase RuvB